MLRKAPIISTAESKKTVVKFWARPLFIRLFVFNECRFFVEEFLDLYRSVAT